MNDLMMELRTEANCINGVISRILLFHYGDVIWWPFIYFSFYFWGSIFAQKPRNQIQHVSAEGVRSCDFFLSIHIMREFTRYRLHEKTELLILSFYFLSIGNGKALRLHSDTHAALPLLAWAVNSHFPVFLRSERRKTGNCRYAAGTYGGNISIRFLILFSLLLPVGGSWVGA